jgi:AAA+ ATPase superfamily predicted ATPase
MPPGTIQNPFRYGIAVDDPYFIDREEEIKDFRRWLTSGQSLIIYSSRRYGKTSLILKLLKQLNAAGYKTVYIDFFKVYSRRRFIELYYRSVIEALPFWEKHIKKISSLTKGFKPLFSLNDEGKSVLSIDWHSTTLPEMDDILNMPEKLAGRKPWIIVFDEFQEINKLNGENFEKEMRASMIHHDKVSYVFLGSQTHMLLNMFTHKNRAFYQFGKIYELQKIPEELQLKFLGSRFKRSGMKVDPDIYKEIIHITDNIPHYIQYLASATWETGLENDMTVEKTTLEKAVQKILINQADYYTSIYDNLTAFQKKVLHAIMEDNKNIFNSTFIEKHRLTSASSVQRAVERFLKDEILEKKGDKYVFTDPFFKYWLENI